MSISIIIPVYNEEDVIVRCLESLGKQTLRPKEIIVVDDGSMDKTASILSKFKVKSEKLKVFKQEHKGPGAARNLGASKSTGDILVFVDADMRFHPTFLDDLTKSIREGKTKGTFSKEEFIANWMNRWARFWNYRRGIFEPRAIPANYPNRAPVFRAILTSEFDRVGGFDELRGYDDDWSLSERLGYRAAAAKAQYYHDNPSTLQEVLSQARWAAKRKYKFGMLGALGALVKAIPLWATPIFIVQLVDRRDQLVDSTSELIVGGVVFSLVAQTGEVIGLAEYLFSKKQGK